MVKSVVGGPSSELNIGDKAKTPSGKRGTVIGLAEFRWGWEYRLRFADNRTRRYRQVQLTKVKVGR